MLCRLLFSGLRSPLCLLTSFLLTTSVLTACDHAYLHLQPGYQLPEFELLKPQTLNQNISAFQQIHVRIGDGQYQYEGAIEITPDHIKMVLLNMWGQRIVTLNYDGKKMRVIRGSTAFTKLPFHHMLSDMQIIFWPENILKNQLEATGWHIDEGAKERKIYYKQQLTAIIEYMQAPSWTAKLVYRNMAYNYEISINSILLD